MRQAEELSITTAPAAPIFGDHSFDTAPPGRHQADVDVGEVIMLQRFDLQRAVAIGDLDAHAAARRQAPPPRRQGIALVENVEHLAPDIAGGADHCDFVTHRSLSEEKCLPSGLRRKGKRQRFYARNALNTTLDVFSGVLMQPFQAVPAAPHHTGRTPCRAERARSTRFAARWRG
jgi:hypothetical protein